MPPKGGRGGRQSSAEKRRGSKDKDNSRGGKAAATNLATGKDEKLVFFDPGLCVGEGTDAGKDEVYLREQLYVPAAVIRVEGELVLVKTPDGEMHRMRAEGLKRVSKQDLAGVPDILRLSDFSEMSLLHTLRVRYSRDDIYSFVGPVLISINPYKLIPRLYDEDTMLSYHNGHSSTATASGGALNHPHLFTVADEAYKALISGGVQGKPSNQSIIISGESGAGKTEAAKIIMQYLARVQATSASTAMAGTEPHATSPVSTPSSTSNGKSSGGGSHTQKKSSGGMAALHVGELERRVLSCNPLLESFGNARTLRNDNSSRFGKFIQIHYDSYGRIIGAEIQNYLLEKTRIVQQSAGERNYHIFYQLLRGADAELVEALQLNGGTSSFAYLHGSGHDAVPGLSDADEFEVTRRCLATLRMSHETQRSIFGLLAAILHLGNVKFEAGAAAEGGGEECLVSPTSISSVEFAARILGVEQAALVTTLCSKRLRIGGNNVIKTHGTAEGMDKRDALAKATYSQLFVWLIGVLNNTICAPAQGLWGFIGLLDIYGFEKFEVNGFEQLCINYANEKLQKHFNKHIFEIEQDEYSAEGIDWSYIQYNDNQPCLDLIDGKPNGAPGILASLDDVQRFKGAEADAKFLAQLSANHAPQPVSSVGGSASKGSGSVGHPNLIVPRFHADTFFGVVHYAGEVFYKIDGFSDKNGDGLNQDIRDLMAASTDPLVKSIFMEGDFLERGGDLGGGTPAKMPPGVGGIGGTPRTRGGSLGGGGRIREASVAAQFKQSLGFLITTLSATSPRYIRCIKPNHLKAANAIDAIETVRQLRYSGMMETIRIRQQGYALRVAHDVFFRKYSVLAPNQSTVEDLVQQLSLQLRVGHRDWQLGHTKAFLRRSLADMLEYLISLRIRAAARTLQRWRRRIVAGRKATLVQTCWRRAHQRRQFCRWRRAACRVQAQMRRRSQLKRFKILIRSIVLVQATIRRRLAKQRVRILKDPLLQMPEEELLEALQATDAELTEALSLKEFGRCDTLQKTLASLQAAVTQRGLTVPQRGKTATNNVKEDNGVSRAELDIQVLEVQLKLEDAEASRDFAACDRLQKSLLEIITVRDANPTASEVRHAASVAKEELSSALAQKDFKRCGELQERVDELEAKAAAMEETSDVGAPSPAVMTSELSELKAQLQMSQGARDFGRCVELQTRIESLEALIAALPTAASVAEEITAVREALQIATTARDYRQRAECTLKLQALEVRLEELGGETAPVETAPPTRVELDKRLEELNTQMDVAAAAKDFRRCSGLQADLDYLLGLHAALPSAASLDASIEALEKSMAEHVGAKNFSECARIESELQVLRLDRAQLKPKPAAPVTPSIEVSVASPPPAAVLPSSPVLANGAPLVVVTSSAPAPERPEVIRVAAVTATAQVSTPQATRVPLVCTTPSARTEVYQPPSTAPKTPRTATIHMSGATSLPPPAYISTPSRPSISSSVSARQSAQAASDMRTADDRPVSKLRPRQPVIMPSDASIAAVAVAMAKAKTDACLLVSADGVLRGILTDNDVTRRVVAKGVDFSECVSVVMTSNPRCVGMEDSAMEALGVMLERHFRHLPVLDKSGAVAGLLDIAKCMYDAINKLENVVSKKNGGLDSEAVMKQLTKAASGSRKGMNANQAAAMQMLMEKMFGEKGEPLLSDVLEEAGEAILVSPRDTVRFAADAMAEGRKAVVVVERGKLVGIFTPKDVLNRVVAVGMSPDDTLVSEVMTHDPDSVPPDTPVLDALHQMHDQGYLHLPVVNAAGRVLGLVDVMEIISATVGKEGSSAWEALFGTSLDADDFSDVASRHSYASTAYSKAKSTAGSVRRESIAPVLKPPVVDDKPVSKLRPKQPVIMSSTAPISEVAVAMANKRTDACLLVGADGVLRGIVTDNDLTRRVVAKGVSASDPVSSIMTGSPRCVGMEDSAMEALSVMLERHFRHLPVVDKSGAVAGLLDIAKCMYDAIKKLEHVMVKKNSEVADSASTLKQLSKAVSGSRKGMNSSQAAAMQMLMEQMFGEKGEPLLSDVLAAAGEAMFVSPRDTVRVAAEAMTEGRKAVSVVERGRLVGILTPKDILNRVLAKGMLPEDTLVSEVMTADPDSVPPDTPVLDALHQMHDQKYLHLPVVAESGRVVGLVDVMEIINVTVGQEGSSAWEALFGTSLDADDFSDLDSHHSFASGRSKAKSTAGSVRKQAKAAVDDRPVSKLKPKQPVIMSSDDSIVDVAIAMANAKTDACLLVSADGVLRGILTDNDVTRRVVAKGIDFSECVSVVMTSNPRCVGMEDSAMEALSIMLERHFRHLPVTNESGAVAGLLDIAKCMYDAIKKLEHVVTAMKSEETEGEAALKQQLTKVVSGSRQGMNASQTAAMQMLMEKMFGEKGEPLLSDVLEEAGEAILVSPQDTVRSAADAMCEGRKAVVVVERGKLVGIFTPKDVLNRVVAKGKSPDDTLVSEVMTANPDSVPPDTPVLDALHQMHDQRYLHLPVVNKAGRVLGLVDVMEIINATVGKEGSSAWEALFGTSLDTDDFSDVNSHHSYGSAHSKVRSAAGSIKKETKPSSTIDRPVSKLRPKVPVLMRSDASIVDVAIAMSRDRTDACLLVNDEGVLRGIVTDNDLTRRVVAKGLNTLEPVLGIMTSNPRCVGMEDSAVDALGVMLERHFRHLPVVDKSGAVAGLLDIAKCMYDAIRRLEHVIAKQKGGETDNTAAREQLSQAMSANRRGMNANQAAAMQMLMEQMFGEKGEPTLSDVLDAAGEAILISPDDTVRFAAEAMAEGRKAVLVVDRGRLVGIFTPKDVLNRVIAEGLSPEETLVSKVMTHNPDSVEPNTPVLDALHQMHDHRYLHLPVVDSNGRVLGLVDVMEIIGATVGQEGGSGWEAFFGSVLDVDDSSDSASERSSLSAAYPPSKYAPPDTAQRMGIRVPSASAVHAQAFAPPTTSRQSSSAYEAHDYDACSDMNSTRDRLDCVDMGDEIVVYKVTDASGNTHKIRSSAEHIAPLLAAVEEKLLLRPPHTLTLKYTDEDGDEIVLCEDSLHDAVEMARTAGGAVKVKAVVTVKKAQSPPPLSPTVKRAARTPPAISPPVAAANVIATLPAEAPESQPPPPAVPAHTPSPAEQPVSQPPPAPRPVAQPSPPVEEPASQPSQPAQLPVSQASVPPPPVEQPVIQPAAPAVLPVSQPAAPAPPVEQPVSQPSAPAPPAALPASQPSPPVEQPVSQPSPPVEQPVNQPVAPAPPAAQPVSQPSAPTPPAELPVSQPSPPAPPAAQPASAQAPPASQALSKRLMSPMVFAGAIAMLSVSVVAILVKKRRN